MSGEHTYTLISENKEPNVPLYIIERDSSGAPFCFYVAFWRPWYGFKCYPRTHPGFVNKEERVKTVPEHMVIPKKRSKRL